MTDTNWEKLASLQAFAVERSHTVGELAIAWLLAHPWLCTVIAGASRPDQLEEHVAAAAWKLTPEEMAELDRICLDEVDSERRFTLR